MNQEIIETRPAVKRNGLPPWLTVLLLLLVLAGAAVFRFTGLSWGEYQYLHPDERFLIWVGTDIAPVENFGDYWNTPESSLNPHNRGHGFYVYGTLPMFLARYVVEWIFGNSGFVEMTQVGRVLSALADLGTVLLVFLCGKKLFDERVGLLAAAFSAAAVLQIQQSHFFTMDTFVTFFSMLAIYFALRVLLGDWWEAAETPVIEEAHEDGAEAGAERHDLIRRFVSHPLFWLSIGFGVALGAAAASKISAVVIALLLPAVLLARLPNKPWQEMQRELVQYFAYLCLAAATSFLVFRIFQPYAFSGPGILGLLPNEAWLNNLKELRNQSTGDVDFPPAIQWARRPIWFAWQNMVQWGMGLPMGLTAWAGFLLAGVAMLRSWRFGNSNWLRYGLLWVFTALYFIWQSIPFNPTMRYQLPVYPTLAIFAGWLIVFLYDGGRRWVSPTEDSQNGGRRKAWLKPLAVGLGVVSLLGTFVYAAAFTSIYTRPITRVAASRWIFQNIPGAINFRVETGNGMVSQPQPFPDGFSIRPELPYVTGFNARFSGNLVEVYFPHVVDVEAGEGRRELQVILSAKPDLSDPLATGSGMLEITAADPADPEDLTVRLSAAVPLQEGTTYYLGVTLQSLQGALALRGSALANETSWDDGLPLRMDNYDGYGGIYRGLNFEMYEDDNPSKLARFLDILNQADYIFITSSRQWGSLTRIPERYPMNVEYFRRLLGCPPEQSVEICYSTATLGSYRGDLGFDLVQVFESSPELGPLKLNDQFAEEAFTVYDHPKVFIFQKRADYDPANTTRILGAVDLSKVVHITPKRAGGKPYDMTLPADRLAEQRQGGTWSELFSPANPLNQSQVLATVVWYLVILLIGIVVYPVVRFALPGLADRGYPLARIAGLLIFSYLVWLAGSFRIPFNPITISGVFLLLFAMGIGAVLLQRKELGSELRGRWNYFLVIEGFFLALFMFDLLLRMANPDLWHPWKGGEKPMDFSYLNAVLKSTSFPPYDPWFAGGYINYYYFGFVMLGVPVKWLGIQPVVAYNLILPTMFSMIAMGAFSVAWNIGEAWKPAYFWKHAGQVSQRSLIFGAAGALGMAVLGNLGILRMIFVGYQRLAAPGGVIEDAGLLTRLVWAIRGFAQAIQGTPLPFAIADWYWNPTRVIPAPNEIEPITEFPFFTVLYGDLHAHLFALPVTLLALSWAFSVLLGRAWQVERANSRRWNALRIGTSLALGGLTIGSLRPLNTWDLPTYLALGVTALAYAIWCYGRVEGNLIARLLPFSPPARRILVAAGTAIALTGLAFVYFQPYAAWYVQGYSEVELWKGTHTPLWAYLVHWGLFLFVIVAWMAWETRDWMAATPLSSLRKLEKYVPYIWSAGFVLAVWIVLLWLSGVKIAWLVISLAAWALVLILRPDQPDVKRGVLFLIGTGLTLTLVVEVLVLRGDISRMNTVFKFYLQVWTLFAISAAAGLGWLAEAMPEWLPKWRSAWQMGFTLLVASAALYPLLGTTAKIKDRMAPEAPYTLDGMEYMQFAEYGDLNTVLYFAEDYAGIRWMQENVQGSPVIVEANLPEYRWGTRYTTYTGLPGVVGWNWHQRQQRAPVEGQVWERVTGIGEFYLTSDVVQIRKFLERYDVEYVIVGSLERAYYPGPGLDKFEALDGSMWREVFRSGQTVIYEVLRGS